jgi:cytochrome P450
MSSQTLGIEIPDLSDPATFASGVPHDAFDAIRAMPELYWQPTAVGAKNGGFWAVTRYRDIVAIEKDPATFTSTQGGAYPQPDNPELQMDNLMMNDPPNHSRLRRVAMKSFGPRVVAQFDDWVRAIVVEALDDLVAKREGDWVTDIAEIVPAFVVARVLGVPREERQQIVDWVKVIFTAQAAQDGGAAMYQSLMELAGYMNKLREVKLADPQDDVVSVVAKAIENQEVTHSEGLNYLALLLIAGFETTHTAIAQSMRLLVENDEIRATARESVGIDGPGPVVDEFLRYITPAMNMARSATRDLEFNGTRIREGDTMQLYFNAANRDPEIYHDPHVFDPTRRERSSLAFGERDRPCPGRGSGTARSSSGDRRPR